MPTVDIISPAGAFTPAAVGDGVTDDAPAFQAFNNWAQAQTSPITLTLGVGAKTFLFNSSDPIFVRGNSPAWNVLQPLTITGNGPSTTILKSPAGFFLGTHNNIKSGNGNYPNTSLYVANVSTVFAGSTQLFCKNKPDSSLFTANTWALMSAIDPQGGGVPPNPYYFEYVFITSVDTINGIITVQSPLKNTYKDTWPNVYAGSPGFQPYGGGPATLYAIDPAWAINVTYSNLGLNQTADGQTYADGLSVVFNNVKTYFANGITPSVNRVITFTGCDLSSYQMEYDKVVESCIFDSTTASIKFQSATPNVTIRNGSNITNVLGSGAFNGTPGSLIISDSTVGGSNIGALSFGPTKTIVSTNVNYSSGFNYTSAHDEGDTFQNNLLQTDYTMSNGLITIPRANLPYGVRFGMPGAWCFWETSNAGTYGPTFQIVDIFGDVTNLYVVTSWQGGFPSYATGIRVHPCQSASFSGTTGTNKQALNLDNACLNGYAGRPILQRSFSSLNGSNMGFNATGSTINLSDIVAGKLVSYIIDVTTPYTGTQATLEWHACAQFDNCGVLLPNGSVGTWGAVIDLRTFGRRVIGPNSATSFGNDRNLVPPDPGMWLGGFGNNVCANVDVSAEYNGNPSIGPVFTATITTDQGIPPPYVPPLRLRMRA